MNEPRLRDDLSVTNEPPPAGAEILGRGPMPTLTADGVRTHYPPLLQLGPEELQRLEELKGKEIMVTVMVEVQGEPKLAMKAIVPAKSPDYQEPFPLEPRQVVIGFATRCAGQIVYSMMRRRT